MADGQSPCGRTAADLPGSPGIKAARSLSLKGTLAGTTGPPWQGGPDAASSAFRRQKRSCSLGLGLRPRPGAPNSPLLRSGFSQVLSGSSFPPT